MKKYELLPLNENIFVAVSNEHKFGTDAFILASFAQIKNHYKVCDLCTGCGIIPLILEKKYTPAEIIGVEIQQQAIEQFNVSLQNSKITSKITPTLCDLKNASDVLQNNYFDVVICNPPYKTNGSGIKNSNKAHLIARHEVLCNINDVCRESYKILKDSGNLFLCQRPERLIDTLGAMRENKIEPKEIRFVSTSYTSAPWLFVVKGTKNGGKNLKVLKPLIVYQNGKDEYTEEMQNMYK